MFRVEKFRFQTILAGAAIALSLTAVNVTLAVADEDDEPTFEQRMIRSMLGGGAARPDIDYRERSPLVIPPAGAQSQLPQPDAATRSRNATAWPKDPDKERARRQKQTGVVGAFEQMREAERPLTPGEMRRGARAGSGRVTQPQRSDAEFNSGRPLTPGEMGETRTLFGMFGNLGSTFSGQQETATFKGEPTRRALTEPPAGYQTPSAAQPYRAPPGTGLLGTVPSFFDRGTSDTPGTGSR